MFFSRKIQIRWADIDANHHLRHSAYYDFGAAVRMMFLNEHGLTTEKMQQLHIGPILFREEAVFRREIRFEDDLTVDLSLIKSAPDYSRWSFQHQFIKGDGILAAVLTIDGAWIDTVKRKLAVPDVFVQTIFSELQKNVAEDKP